MTPSSTVIHGIGRLLTNDPTRGRGPTGELADAWLVVVGDEVVEVGTGSPPAADTAIDADGRCVMPGFVDSHSHLVFAGDRVGEFAARMAGGPYSAGGINVTVAATRLASDDELRRRVGDAACRGPALWDDHDRDQVRLRPGDRPRGTSAACRRRDHVRDDVPRRPRRSRRVHRTGGRLRRPRSPARCWTAAPHTPGGSTPSAKPARSPRISVGRCSKRGEPSASACACTPISSGPATVCASASSSVVRPSTTAPTSPIDDVDGACRRAPPWRRSFRPRTSRPASRIPTPAGFSTLE